MKRVIIIQARMTSTRLPGKVLMDLAGRPMLNQQLHRLKRCREIDEIVVATTTNDTDEPIVEAARAEGVRWFRGSEEDVLSRYLGAAREAQADIIVRITSDCPLIDSEVTDRVVSELELYSSRVDYAANIIDRTFPRGLDCEAFFYDTLERLDRLGTSPASREHVTFFLVYERRDLFSVRSIADSENNSDLRWTVDVQEDLDLVRHIYTALDLGQQAASYRQILDYVRAQPGLMSLNAHVVQKSA